MILRRHRRIRSGVRPAVRCVVLLLAIAAFPAIVRSQGTQPAATLGVGGFVGYEHVMGVANIPVFAGYTECGLFSGGAFPTLNGGVTLAIPGLFGPLFGLQARAGLAAASGFLSHQPDRPIYIREPNARLDNDKFLTVEYEQRLNASWLMFRLDLMGEYQLGERWSARLGPWVGRRFNASLSQTEALIDEPIFRFDGGVDERSMTGGERLVPSDFAAGFVGGIGYSIPTSGRLTFVPELTLRTELTSAVGRLSWQSYAAGIGLSVMFNGAHPEPEQPLARLPELPDSERASTQSGAQMGAHSAVQSSPTAPSAAKDAPSRPMKLSASLDLFGVDEEGHRLPQATVRVYEVLRRQRASLLESIFFDDGAAGLPARYVRIPRDRTRAFTLDSLFGLDPMEMHYHSLNVIGYRMRRNPAAAITVAGSVSKGEPDSLVQSRAHAVREYLTTIWGIDSSRIAIAAAPAPVIREGGEDQRAENRRAQITSSTSDVLDPVLINKVARDFEPPLISLDPQFVSDAGIKRWQVELSHNGLVVGRIGSGDTSNSRLNLNWQVDEEKMDLAKSVLTATLTVEDSAGNSVSTRGQVPLAIERSLRIVDRSERRPGTETITYSLLTFAHGSADVTMRNRTVLAEAAAAARSGSRITVVGYTDRTGSDEGNRALSRRRADNVARVLRALLRDRGVRNVSIEMAAEGYEAGRYDNTLPEGRALSREVDVVLERSDRR